MIISLTKKQLEINELTNEWMNEWMKMNEWMFCCTKDIEKQ